METDEKDDVGLKYQQLIADAKFLLSGYNWRNKIDWFDTTA